MKRVAVAGVALLVLAGCGTGGEPASPSSTPSSIVTSSIPTPSATPTPTQTPTPTPTPKTTGLALGEAWDQGLVTFKVLEFERRSETRISDPLGGALVQACVTGRSESGSVTLSWDAWSVAGSDGERYPTTNYQTIKTPEFPRNDDDLYAEGECAKGWILFDTNGAQISQIRYDNEFDDKAIWKVE